MDVYRMPWGKGVAVRAQDGGMTLSYVGVYEANSDMCPNHTDDR